MSSANVRVRCAGLAVLAVVCAALAGAADAVVSAPKPMVAFLGVGVQPVGSPAGEELGLAEGVGLRVRTVQEQSPAQHRINVEDVLVRLDDQILVDFYQLAVLVRTYKPGTEVKVTLLRGGNEMEVPVTLGEREATPLPAGGWPLAPGMAVVGGGGGQRPDGPLAFTVNGGTVTINVAGLGEQAGGGEAAAVAVTVAGDARRTATTVVNGTSYSLSTTNGLSTFTVTAPDAKVLFSGPVNTDEDKARVPEAFRARLAALQAPVAQPAEANVPAPAP